jgi:hypothetical protein
VTAFLVPLAAAVVMFAGLVVDGGLALAAKVEAIGVAQEAARAGAQEVDLAAFRDTGTVRLLPDQAAAAARRHLDQVGAAGTVTVVGDTVEVTVTADYDTQLLGVLGLRTLAVTGTGSAHPVPPPAGEPPVSRPAPLSGEPHVSRPAPSPPGAVP